MGKVLKCGDVVPGCNVEVRGESDEEVLRKGAEHAKNDHGMETIPPEVAAKVRGAIHDDTESAARGAAAGS
jgi:predicted small metal-binding protein